MNPTCLLAIETTGVACSVAVAHGGDVLEDIRVAERRHNALVLGMVDGLLAAAGLVPNQLDAVAFSAGPGSFTGVRIGAAVAQGIALGVDVGVARVPTSAVMAEQIRRRASAAGVVTKRLSRRGWHYVARYRFTDDGTECLAGDVLLAEDAPLDVAEDWLLAAREERLHASVLAELASVHPLVGAAAATPLYVDGDSPWRKTRG